MIFPICPGLSADFPGLSFSSFSAYQRHLRGTVPKESAIQSGPFPKKRKPPGLETPRFGFSHLFGKIPHGRCDDLRTKDVELRFLQRKTKGGETQGRGKHTITPPQKRFWTPPLMIRFPPPFVYAMSFSLEEMGTDQTNPTF